MDQVSFPGWQPEKSISVIISEQTTQVLVKGQPYVSWQSEDEGCLRLAIVQLCHCGLGSEEELAAAFGRHVNSVRNYLAAFAEEGMRGESYLQLFERHYTRTRWLTERIACVGGAHGGPIQTKKTQDRVKACGASESAWKKRFRKKTGRTTFFYLHPALMADPTRDAVEGHRTDTRPTCGELRPSRNTSTPGSFFGGGGRPRCESILLAHLLVPMLRVGDEFSASWVHDEVQVFQWNLAQEVRHIVVNFHHLKYAVAAPKSQAHWLEDRAAANAIRGLRLHFAFLVQAQRLDEAGLEVKPRSSGVHQRLSFHSAGFRPRQFATDGNQVSLVGQLDCDDDFTHG